MDDLEWHELDAQASKVLVMCWLIASEADGNLPDIKTLAFRLRMSEKDTKDCIIKLSHWVEQDDIAVISHGYQDVSTETETKKEKRQKATGVAMPDGIDKTLWEDFLALRRAKKLPVTQTALDGIKAQGAILGFTLAQTLTEQINRGWGGFQASWILKERASNPADRIHMTVPGKQERDPALVKLDNDAKATIPMPTNIKEQLDKLRRQA